MKQLLLAVMLAVLGGQAAALSCARPDPIETFQRIGVSPEPYIVLYGQLSFDEAALDTGDGRVPVPPASPVPATFKGQGLTMSGFREIADAKIDLQVTCAGPWCGSARSGVDAVYFVSRTPDALIVEADPCGGLIFEAPSREVRAMLTSCMQGRQCTPLPPQ